MDVWCTLLTRGVFILTSYAVIQTGGKQYQVKSGDVIDVEKLEAQVGSRVELADVRFVSEESGVSVGTPIVDGAMVTAEVEDQFRGPKIIVFKYKSKTHYRKKNGHRQSYTRIRIQDILTGGATPPPLITKDKIESVDEEKPTPARRTRARAATTTTEAAAGTTDEKPTPARRTRARAATATTETAAGTTDEKPTPARQTRARAATATPEAAVGTTDEKPTPARRTRARAATVETVSAEEIPVGTVEPTLPTENVSEETSKETKD